MSGANTEPEGELTEIPSTDKWGEWDKSQENPYLYDISGPKEGIIHGSNYEVGFMDEMGQACAALNEDGSYSVKHTKEKFAIMCGSVSNNIEMTPEEKEAKELEDALAQIKQLEETEKL